MLSVLIVDDEVITRKGLRTHVHWDKLNIDKVLDCGSAAEALHLVEEVRPDIVLSDVNMPGMNGIEMCRNIRQIHDNCQIVFLSGYSDKEYLRGAISLEAVDYVEKPIDIEEVESALRKACDKQRRALEDQEKLRRLERENYSMSVRRLIERLILPTGGSRVTWEDLLKVHLDWSQMKRFQVVLVRLVGRQGSEMREKIASVKEVVRCTDYLYAQRENNHLVFICAFKDEELFYLENGLNEYISTEMRQGIYCALGEAVPSKKQIYESYQSAVIRLQQMVFWNHTGSWYGEEDTARGNSFDEKIFLDFQAGLRQYSKESVQLAEEKLHASMLAAKGMMVSSVKGIYFRFLEAVFRHADHTAQDEGGVDAGMVSMIWEKLHEIETLEGCRIYLREETEGFFDNVKELAESNKTMIAVISYIQANYADPDLNLEQIADRVYLTQNYLSGLFRKKMGKTISQYILDVRMDNAKVLLRRRDMKLYDVASDVGYRDSKYFAKTFKKAVGVTPSEYREKYEA